MQSPFLNWYLIPGRSAEKKARALYPFLSIYHYQKVPAMCFLLCARLHDDMRMSACYESVCGLNICLHKIFWKIIDIIRITVVWYLQYNSILNIWSAVHQPHGEQKRESGESPERSGHCDRGASSRHPIVPQVWEGEKERWFWSQETCFVWRG